MRSDQGRVLAGNGTRLVTDPGKAREFFHQGKRYSRLKLHAEAAVAYQLAVQLNPNHADAYFGLGQTYSETGRWEAAIDAFERGLSLDPDNKEAFSKLRTLYAKVRKQKKSASPNSQTRTAANNESATNSIPKGLNQSETKVVTTSPSVRGRPSAAQNQTEFDRIVEKQFNQGTNSMSRPAASSPIIVGTLDKKAAADPPPVPVAEKVAASKSNSTNVTNLEPTRVYRVGIGDMLEVRVRDAQMSQANSYPVTATGLLEYPGLVQPLPVEGLTVEQISERLKGELMRLALSESPEVLVGVRDYASHTILISGHVKEPGTKVLRREAIPLYVVLADAQPLPEAGRVTVISNTNANPITVHLSDPAATSLLIRTGDVVMVQPAPQMFFYIGGAVKIPGEKIFRAKLSLTQALLIAGGVLHKPQEAEVELAREGSEGRLRSMRFKLKEINSGKLPDPLVQPGDRITVLPD